MIETTFRTHCGAAAVSPARQRFVAVLGAAPQWVRNVVSIMALAAPIDPTRRRRTEAIYIN